MNQVNVTAYATYTCNVSSFLPSTLPTIVILQRNDAVSRKKRENSRGESPAKPNEQRTMDTRDVVTRTSYVVFRNSATLSVFGVIAPLLARTIFRDFEDTF